MNEEAFMVAGGGEEEERRGEQREWLLEARACGAAKNHGEVAT
jgi:hypothetical protein